MKLKQYIRGIGVGMIVTVVLYSAIIIPRKYTLSDEEIMERAKELGMVMQEDVDLSGLTGTPSPEPTFELTPEPTPTPTDVPPAPSAPEKPSEIPSPTVQATLTPKPTATTAPSPTPKPTPTTVPSPTPKPTPTTAPSPTPKPTPTTTPSLTPKPTPTTVPSPTGSVAETRTVTVAKGMWSAEFARAAQRAGLVENAEEFDAYLIRNGYASKIRVGTYELPVGASYYEIAEAVTKK